MHHSLCLRNVADAQKKQNYIESCRWSVFAERERAIAKWEAEQMALYRANLSVSRRSPNRQPIGTQGSRRINSSEECGSYATKSPISRIDPPSTLIASDAHATAGPIVEIPYSTIDGSQSLHANSTPAEGNYLLAGTSHQEYPHIDSDPFRSGSPHLSRSTSMQRHIPSTSLRMAPTPLRPRIDHQSVPFPAPQEPRLSYIQPAEANANYGHGLTETFPSMTELNVGENLTGLPSSLDPVTPASKTKSRGWFRY